ncbi:MAG: DUF4367 domain-containing protein [Firmicutes bacterium]|nr:DUF4367 domain-containing protein [Bacillota bacterium]MDD4264212.1 DUF4367 domain-containing protein [Bacillota bacterium]MDD4694448.1 DUF4367 domain-containing protein [Bacillota bacterium]
MAHMKDFREIADKNMEGIKVNSQLRAKTLAKLHEKPSSTRFLVPVIAAASLVLILGIAFWPKSSPLFPEGNLKEPQPLLYPEEPNMILSEPRITPLRINDKGTWSLDTATEAKENFGESFLMPSLVPQGFVLESIQASGKFNETDRIVLNYLESNREDGVRVDSRERRFQVIQEKVASPWEVVGFDVVDLEGYVGFLSPDEDENNELHFFNENTHYLIVGALEKDELIEIANSMITE